MHHVGLVEAMMIDRPAPVADVDVRGLRQRREQLVGGMGGKDGGAFGCAAGSPRMAKCPSYMGLKRA